MSFQHDIFISYAHLDNNPLSEEKAGWVTELDNNLKVLVPDNLGKPVDIWRDSKLQGNDVFTQEIEEKFKAAKLLISVISPRYIESEWCRKEIVEYLETAEKNIGFAIENKARIFKVMKKPVDLKVLPPKINKEELDYRFYKYDANTGRHEEYRTIFGEESKTALFKALNILSQDIADLIRKIDAHSEGTAGQEGAVSGRKIYLAETTPDCYSLREDLKSELKGKGFTVLPDGELPYLVADSFSKKVSNYINDCTLSIHLVGSVSAIVPGGSDQSIIEMQHDAAVAQGLSRGLERLVWLKPNPDPLKEDKELNIFKEKIKTNEQLHQNTDWLDDNFEKFKTAIFEKISKIEQKEKEKLEAIENEKLKQKAATQSTAIPISETPYVYLICDQQDKAEAKAIKKYLFSKGLDVDFNTSEGTFEEKQTAHDKKLEHCDAVILYYGANANSFSTMAIDLKRIPNLNREKKTEPLMVVYKGPPPNEDKEDYESHDFMIVNGMAGFKEELFNDFLKKIGKPN